MMTAKAAASSRYRKCLRHGELSGSWLWSGNRTATKHAQIYCG